MASIGQQHAPSNCPKILMTFITFMTFLTFVTHGNAFRKYITCLVLKKFEESFRILKKLVPACVVNVIHAKTLLGSLLYVKD